MFVLFSSLYVFGFVCIVSVRLFAARVLLVFVYVFMFVVVVVLLLLLS